MRLEVTGSRGVDRHRISGLGDLLGRVSQFLLEPGYLRLNRLRFVVETLDAGAIGLIDEFGQLELDSEGVIFESWIVHVMDVPNEAT